MRFFVLLQVFLVQAFLVHTVLSAPELPPTTDTPESTLTDADLAWIEDEISYQKIPFITEHNLLVTRVGQLTSEYSEFELDIKAIDDEVEEIKNNQPCVDTVDGKFEDSKKGGKLVKCTKLTNVKLITRYCTQEGDKSASKVCPLSCETCTNQPCEDTVNGEFLYSKKGIYLKCNKIFNADKIEKYCKEEGDQSASNVCPLSCGTCLTPECVDTLEVFYLDKEKTDEKYCTDITKGLTKRENKKYCGKSKGKCPLSCDEC